MRRAQGRDNARLFLKDNAELCQQLEDQLRAMLEEEKAKAAAEREARNKRIEGVELDEF